MPRKKGSAKHSKRHQPAYYRRAWRRVLAKLKKQFQHKEGEKSES